MEWRESNMKLGFGPGPAAGPVKEGRRRELLGSNASETFEVWTRFAGLGPVDEEAGSSETQWTSLLDLFDEGALPLVRAFPCGRTGDLLKSADSEPSAAGNASSTSAAKSEP